MNRIFYEICDNKSLLLLMLTVLIAFSGCERSVQQSADDVTTEQVDTVCSTSADSEKTLADESKEHVPSYDELIGMLREEISKKDFCSESEALLYDSFYGIYQNYDSWMHLYRDMPTKEEYLMEHFIDTIQYINAIEYHDVDSEEGKELIESGCHMGFVTLDEDELPYIFFMANKKENAEILKREYDLQLFYHEVSHIHGRNIAFDFDSFSEFAEGKYESDFMEVFVEGGATFHQKFTARYTEACGGIWGVANEDYSREIEYRKSDCAGYLIFLNDYEKLMYLAGYETMLAMERGELTFEEFVAIINERYEVIGPYLVMTMMERAHLYDDDVDGSWKNDELYDLSVRLENLFLMCMRQDLLSSTGEEFEKNEALFRGYVERNLPVVTTADGEVITDEVFDVWLVERCISEMKTPSVPAE